MKKYRLSHTLMQRLAVSPPGAWFFSKIQQHLDVFGFRTISRRHTASKVMAGLPIVMVTICGARSGKKRTVPLVYVQTDSEADRRIFAVVASNWGLPPYPAWYLNLKATPEAECDIEGVSGQYVGREAEGEEYQDYRAAALTTYIGFPKYYERLAGTRPIPIIVFRPVN